MNVKNRCKKKIQPRQERLLIRLKLKINSNLLKQHEIIVARTVKLCKNYAHYFPSVDKKNDRIGEGGL